MVVWHVVAFSQLNTVGSLCLKSQTPRIAFTHTRAFRSSVCVHTTNLPAGVEPYTKAVAALFDPAVSRADLISSQVSGENSITLRWRLEGKLKIGECGWCE